MYAPVDSSLQYYFSGEAGTKSPMLAERESRYRPQLAQVKPGNDVVQPKVRKAFPDTAYWAPYVHTDAQGHARVTMTFPGFADDVASDGACDHGGFKGGIVRSIA